jgi:hypothetical protein
MWRERLAALFPARGAPQSGSAVQSGDARSGDVQEPAADFVMTTTAGGIGKLASTSDLPAQVEKDNMRATIAIVDVSGSMNPFKPAISAIVRDVNTSCSTANIPAGQMTLLCFADSVQATLDLSVPNARDVNSMGGGTSYTCAFEGARERVQQIRSEYPQATFNIAFMTDGQDQDSLANTRAALARLHDELGVNDVMTTVFFAERAGAVPPLLQTTSKPALDKVPVMSLSDPSYFRSWLFAALEQTAVALTLELSLPGGKKRVAIVNNGETMSGAVVGYVPPPSGSAVQATLRAGWQEWPCTVRIAAAEAVPVTAALVMQIMQTAVQELVRADAASVQSALADIRFAITQSKDAAVRAELTKSEMELLERLTSNLQLEDTSGALTSQRLQDRETMQKLLSSLQLQTYCSQGLRCRHLS